LFRKVGVYLHSHTASRPRWLFGEYLL